MTSEKLDRTLRVGLKYVAGDNSPRDTTLSIISAAKRKNLSTTTDSIRAEKSTPDLSQAAVVKVTEFRSIGSSSGAKPRIHEEQADELTLMARRLNLQSKRPDGTTAGERITDNTLIRIAIDLLLERREELQGNTEKELAGSLGLNPRNLNNF